MVEVVFKNQNGESWMEIKYDKIWKKEMEKWRIHKGTALEISGVPPLCIFACTILSPSSDLNSFNNLLLSFSTDIYASSIWQVIFYLYIFPFLSPWSASFTVKGKKEKKKNHLRSIFFLSSSVSRTMLTLCWCLPSTWCMVTSPHWTWSWRRQRREM